MEKIANFLDDLKIAGHKLNMFSLNIEDKEKNIKLAVQNFKKNLESISKSEYENMYTNLLNQRIKKFNDYCNEWIKIADQQIDGKEFINQFEKSIVFVVFGNVNVGKSSLGNFVSGKNSVLEKLYLENPNFYSYDFAQKKDICKAEMLNGNHFAVNDIEETTSIQYFTLYDSLTWVDTPGIHSINYENEELAKQYVNYADMVLFVTSSSSPAKQDEFIEMSRLIQKKKPMIIVINKSDMQMKVNQDGKIIKKIIPKDKNDRISQENYVKNLFNETKLGYAQSVESISVSVKLAENAIEEKSEDVFEKSGFPKFYNMLGTMLKDNAIELKEQAPKMRVNSLINELLNGFNLAGEERYVYGIKMMKQEFKDIINEIDSKIEEVKEMEDKILKKVKENTINEIDLVIRKMGQKLQQNGTDNNDIDSIINEIITKQFNEQLSIEIIKLLKDYNHKCLKNIDMNLKLDLRTVTETLTYNDYSVYETNRKPDGFIENIQHIFLNKEFKDVKIKTTTVEKTNIIGDNSAEVVESILNDFEEKLRPILKKALDEVTEGYFNEEKKAISSIVEKISETEKELLNIQY